MATGFRVVGITLIAFCAVNIAVFCAVSADPQIADSLALAPDQPSGIVTSVVTHQDPIHLAGNLSAFAILSIFFVGINLSADSKERQRASKIFGLGSLAAGIAASAAEFGVWSMTGVTEISAIGASGMVYGAVGILLAYAIYNVPRCVVQLRGGVGSGSVRWDESGVASPGLFFSVAFSTYFVVALPYLAIFQAGLFFNVAPEVAWLAHEFGFLFGFLAVMVLLLVLRHSRRQVDEFEWD